MYYANHNPYGINTINRGNRANILRGFHSKKRRDQWVAQDPDFRAPISAGFARRILSGFKRAGLRNIPAALTEGIEYQD